MRFLTPTDNKRLNELIGFLCVTFAVLMALALISYSPHDVALNVSAPPTDGPLARNWIGPVGAYGADLLFQVLGFAAFLLPLAIAVLGWRWFRSRAIDSQTATLVGYGLLLLSLPSLLVALAFPGCPGSPSTGRLARLRHLQRIADWIQHVGRKPRGNRPFDHRSVHDHEIFVLRCARLG